MIKLLNESKHEKDQKVKEIISTKVFKAMNDQSAASALRKILFNPNNKIDWNKAYEIMLDQMPELNLKESAVTRKSCWSCKYCINDYFATGTMDCKKDLLMTDEEYENYFINNEGENCPYYEEIEYSEE